MEEATNIDEVMQFDVVSDCSDHYYFCSTTKDADYFDNAQSSVHRRIMKEWRSLQESLPESIFVRVYETRINLLRAAVIGAAGTPYHDGLFFFDIAFPRNYPSQPPMVRYRSFGFRLNPNLYASGYICLSLLNTWHGRSRERWIPTESTVLQVLLSLQSLVLNQNPLFNEPSIAKSKKRSIDYNGDVFVLTCKSTWHLIRRPPRNFESFVRLHFRRRANAILMACEQYANGRAMVGFYVPGPPTAAAAVRDSPKLQTAIATVYPSLVAAFQGIGANLLEGVEVLQLKKMKDEKRKTEGLLKKVIKKIRKMFWD